MKPLISVVVPVIGDEPLVSVMLQSIVAQGGPVQIVLVDGGCSPETRRDIHRFSAHVDRWIRRAPDGVADAFNAGIESCRGDWVGFLGADDHYVDRAFEHLNHAIRSRPVDVICGAVWMESADRKRRPYTLFPRPSILSRRMSLYHSSMFVRRRLFEEHGVFDASFRLAMDAEWCHRVLQGGASLRCIAEVLSVKRLGGRSDMDSVAALEEYRRSSVSHGLASPFSARVFYWQHRVAKLVLRPAMIANAYRSWLDRDNRVRAIHSPENQPSLPRVLPRRDTPLPGSVDMEERIRLPGSPASRGNPS